MLANQIDSRRLKRSASGGALSGETERGNPMAALSPKQEITLKYSWRKTWPDQENDFTGFDRDRLDSFGKPTTIGRFYLKSTPQGQLWAWYSQWHPPGSADLILPTGLSETPREAAREIEHNYELLFSRHR